MRVDAHHHLWDLSVNYYPWLTDHITPKSYGDYSEIRRDYLVSDFIADCAPVGVMHSVHIQAGHDPSDPLRETRWLDAVADSSNVYGGLPSVIVGDVPFRPDGFRILEGHRASPRFRGVRQIFSGSPLSSSQLEDFLNTPTANDLLRSLEASDLSFDIQIRPDQANVFSRLMQKYPDLSVIVCHAGMPVDQSHDGLSMWRNALREIASNDNALLKISGFGMFDPKWSEASVKPLVRACIDEFGPQRCAFGSNYPVERLSKSYAEYWQIIDRIVSDMSESERTGMLNENARRFYRF